MADSFECVAEKVRTERHRREKIGSRHRLRRNRRRYPLASLLAGEGPLEKRGLRVHTFVVLSVDLRVFPARTAGCLGQGRNECGEVTFLSV